MVFSTNDKNFPILRLMFHFLPYHDKMKNLYGEGSFIDQRLKFANFCA